MYLMTAEEIKETNLTGGISGFSDVSAQDLCKIQIHKVVLELEKDIRDHGISHMRHVWLKKDAWRQLRKEVGLEEKAAQNAGQPTLTTPFRRSPESNVMRSKH